MSMASWPTNVSYKPQCKHDHGLFLNHSKSRNFNTQPSWWPLYLGGPLNFEPRHLPRPARLSQQRHSHDSATAPATPMSLNRDRHYPRLFDYELFSHGLLALLPSLGGHVISPPYPDGDWIYTAAKDSQSVRQGAANFRPAKAAEVAPTRIPQPFLICFTLDHISTYDDSEVGLKFECLTYSNAASILLHFEPKPFMIHEGDNLEFTKADPPGRSEEKSAGVARFERGLRAKMRCDSSMQGMNTNGDGLTMSFNGGLYDLDGNSIGNVYLDPQWRKLRSVLPAVEIE
ncbi:hypothetical protein BKA70DRAFT_1232287 [Coprinopsis sp. MPI-PUGE-AT-0042]|nr:hypothetical protein BKA70DRAFT_1232287 [Coprinopsis sp. MPI-PUGE-AT-0042]